MKYTENRKMLCPTTSTTERNRILTVFSFKAKHQTNTRIYSVLHNQCNRMQHKATLNRPEEFHYPHKQCCVHMYMYGMVSQL